MKKYLLFAGILMGLMITAESCKQNTTVYSDQLKAEKKLINKWVEDHNIEIIYEDPARYEDWVNDPSYANKFLELGDYCYFHLTQLGDTTSDPIVTGDQILARYRKYTLTQNPDTFSYWNTNEMPYPVEFQYNRLSDNSCTAWHYAIKHMQYTGAEATIIVPSKLGFSADNKTVTPYGYDLRIQVQKW